MSKSDRDKAPVSQQPSREERLAEALRRNLKRRKAPPPPTQERPE